MGVRSDKIFMALSAKTIVDGLWVGASGGEEKKLLRKFCESMALIKTHDPLRYKRLCKDTKRIWVTLLPGAYGTYEAQTDCCKIDSRFTASYEPIFIASVIVHEATHARLRRFGYAEAVRLRLEAACYRQQIAFAKKVPDNQAVIDWLQARFPSSDGDYTYEAWAQCYNRGLVTAARDMGIPSWLVRTLFRIRGLLERLATLRRRVSRARQAN